MMPESNRKALEEKVDSFNPVITARAAALAESLSDYGFQGNVSISLTVSVEDSQTGIQKASVERKMDFRFKR